MSKQKANAKGFTIIELMIVVTIILIILAIAIPAYNASVEQAELEERKKTEIIMQSNDVWYSPPKPAPVEKDCLTINGKRYCEEL